MSLIILAKELKKKPRTEKRNKKLHKLREQPHYQNRLGNWFNTAKFTSVGHAKSLSHSPNHTHVFLPKKQKRTPFRFRNTFSPTFLCFTIAMCECELRF